MAKYTVTTRTVVYESYIVQAHDENEAAALVSSNPSLNPVDYWEGYSEISEVTKEDE